MSRDTLADAQRTVSGRVEAALDRVLGGSWALQIVVLYALTRLVSAVMLAVVAPTQAPSSMTDGLAVGYFGFTRLWDGEWYELVATSGYPASLPRDALGTVQQNAWAFYPLFPFLARAVMEVTGLSFAAAASTLALVLGFGAAVVMGAVLRPRLGRAAALLVIGLYAVFPASPVLQVAYTESLAMLLLCGYLLALSRGRWLGAAALALLIGVTRPIALPLAVVTVVALWLRWRRRTSEPLGRREVIGGLAALAGCGIAGLVWPAIAGLATGEPLAYFETMKAWSWSGQIQLLGPWFSIPKAYFGPWAPLAVGVTLALLVVAIVGPWAQRLGPELRVWTLGYAAYVLAAQTPGTSTVRYLLPMFPVLAVMLGVSGERGRGHGIPTAVRAAALAAVFLWLQWLWISVLWHFTPPTDWAP